MGVILDLSLLSGPFASVLQVVAFVAGAWLLWTVRRSAPAMVLGVCAISAAVLTAGLVFVVRHVWHLFPDQLEPPVYGWLVAAVMALTLMVAAVVVDWRWRQTTLTVIAGVLVLAGCANQINRTFEAYPALRDVFGAVPDNEVPFTELSRPATGYRAGRPIDAHWQPRTLPTGPGRLATVRIPAQVSGFAARPAEVYFPPAYFADPRPALPVLVLISGQPGGPRDWIAAGRLAAILDRFAAEHHGLAPVAVVADATGSRFANPLCLDSRLGNAATYLGVDLPAWVKKNLSVDTDPNGWAVAGFSYGGTCALQLATNYPGVYPTFVDIAGGIEPSLVDRRSTVEAAFGGDAAAFSQVNPLDLLQSRRYPDSAGAIVAGAGDDESRTAARTVLQAARTAALNAHYTQVPGSHDWGAARAALDRELPWLATRIGLIA
ncbi:hypothetical protein A5630_06915 [Mycolicibacterium mucogenicum]|uniref:Esterase n=2 Tax=Mycobacteriaceae TaxID=1762 RepID=A0A1A3GME0_MYCMU|nr:hypothetical protein A5630_06915 [Mycolicibacterium mucogenicum]